MANRPVNGADPATKGNVRLGRRAAESWPCDPDLERSLLGVCLWGKAKEVVQALEAQDLAVSAHGEIFGAIASLVEQGEATFDVWTLASELRHRGSLDSIGGVAYLADLDRGIVVEQDVGLRSKKLRGLANRRRLLHVSDELQRKAADLTEPLADTKAWLRKVLDALD